jgi:SAM-dependent methyltransferase
VPGKAIASREYWENRLSEKWGLHGVGHISYGKPYNEWLYRVRRRVLLRELDRLPLDLRASTVLDIGSGTGFWLKIWKSVGVRNLVGSDLTRVAVENLRDEHPTMEIRELDIADPESIAGLKGKFDLISAFDVLFHITDEDQFKAAIANVASLLRPGGYFLFSDFLVHRVARRALHEVDRTLENYVSELSANGMETRLRVPVFVLMNTPIDSLSPVPRLIWRLSMSPVRLFQPLGHVYGLLLYPIELALTKIVRESPTTELMICQRIPVAETLER